MTMRHKTMTGAVLGAALAVAGCVPAAMADDEAANPEIIFGRTFTRAQKLAGKKGADGIWRADFACNAALPPDAEGFTHVRSHAPQFFFENDWAEPARWPNEGWASVETVVESGLTGRCLDSVLPDNPVKPGSFTIADDRPAGWDFSAGVYLSGYLKHDWAFERIRIESFTPSNRLIRLAGPTTYGIGGQSWGGYSRRRFFCSNIRAELDAPRECFYDRARGQVEYIPPEGGKGDAIYGVADTEPLLRLVGVRDRVYDGCVFARGAGDGIVLENCTNVIFRNCRVSDVGGDGFVIRGGSGVKVTGCSFRRLGRGGVIVHGGDRRRLVRAGHRVEGCDFADFARLNRTCSPAVSLGGCGIDVVRNRIHDAPHSGILYGGNEHSIVSNELCRILLETGDAGAIYTGRDPTSRGNVVAFNYIHDLGRGDAGVANTMGIYLDDCDCGDAVVSNRIVNVSRGMMLGGGQDNPVIGNTFENCTVGMSIDARGTVWHAKWDSPTDKSWQMTRKVNEMPVAEEPWRSRYPRMAGYLQDHPKEPRYNPIHGNKFLGCGARVIELASEFGDNPELLKVLDVRDNFYADLPGHPSARPDSRIASGFWPRVTYDNAGYFIDGERGFLVSGEFHYFRVPKADWRRRMDLAREAGMNAVATYVPWLIHEPTEGRFAWSDCDARDFRGFLKTAQEAGLMVIVRPGPYQYSELRHCGIPAWVLEKKELRAKNVRGDDINADCSVSYNHPEFLRLARRYYKSFADEVRPYMQQNGGPVVMVQLDNELTGIHDWMGGHDHNPETFGFGREDGYFAQWLRRKYGTLGAVNAAYGTDWKSFAEARPFAGEVKTDGERRRYRDFRKCYLANGGEYLATLRSWLAEDGIAGPYCNNCANADMNHNLRPAMKRLANGGVLFGSDHYYTLGIGYAQEAPTIKYAMTCRHSLDTLGGWGFPPTVFEMPAGSISSFPGMFPNDLLACYMMNFAYGMKGVNYYIFTGGPNFDGTGGTCDVYDYNAPVAADGKVRPTYRALKDFGAFLAARRDLADSRRLASVAVAVVSDLYDGSGLYAPAGAKDVESVWDVRTFVDNGLLYSLSATPYTARHVELETAALDPAVPLVLPGMLMMDAAVQRKVADFVLAGGSLLAVPALPAYDWDLRPCTVLADALGALPATKAAKAPGDNVLEALGERLYGMDFKWAFKPGKGDEAVMRNVGTGETIGYFRRVGKGRFCQLGTKWTTTFPEQTRMLAKVLDRLGAQKVVGTDSLNLPAELHRKPDGSLVAFVLNLHASPQTANLEVWKDGKSCFRREVTVEAMQVLPVDVR